MLRTSRRVPPRLPLSPSVHAMAEEEGGWDHTVQEWLIDEGYCCAGALAYLETAEMFAAAPAANEEGWGYVYKEDHDEQIMQEDMTEKTETIHEQGLLLEVSKGNRPKNGLWIGGLKYTITRISEDTAGSHDVQCVMAQRTKKGACIVNTK